MSKSMKPFKYLTTLLVKKCTLFSKLKENIFLILIVDVIPLFFAMPNTSLAHTPSCFMVLRMVLLPVVSKFSVYIPHFLQTSILKNQNPVISVLFHKLQSLTLPVLQNLQNIRHTFLQHVLDALWSVSYLSSGDHVWYHWINCLF